MSLDVHPPHEPIHSWRDFLLHLLTITIGLLIAVGIEGIVEWQHHRHLAHEAETSLNIEITHNRQQLARVKQELTAQNKVLAQDLKVLASMRGGDPIPPNSMSISYAMQTFDSAAWRTAQTTGALAYMSYGEAQQFVDIYEGQELLYRTQQAVLDDVVHATGTVATHDKLSSQNIDELMTAIGGLQIRFNVVASVAASLDRAYQQHETEAK